MYLVFFALTVVNARYDEGLKYLAAADHEDEMEEDEEDIDLENLDWGLDPQDQNKTPLSREQSLSRSQRE